MTPSHLRTLPPKELTHLVQGPRVVPEVIRAAGCWLWPPSLALHSSFSPWPLGSHFVPGHVHGMPMWTLLGGEGAGVAFTYERIHEVPTAKIEWLLSMCSGSFNSSIVLECLVVVEAWSPRVLAVISPRGAEQSSVNHSAW